MDLLDSTPRQIYLQRLLGLASRQYLHLPLVLDSAGRKLSKRDGDHPRRSGDPLPALRAASAISGNHGFIPADGPRELLDEAVGQFDAAFERQFQPDEV